MPAQSDLNITDLLAYFVETYATPEVDTTKVLAAADHFNVSYPTVCKRLEKFKVSRGKWNLTAPELEKTYQSPSASPAVEVSTLIPSKDKNYVPFGNFTDLKKIINSGVFYPTFITGLSGNGKTMGVEQACAQTNRELIRVNITIETDEDDLIGGFRLIDGNTVWHNGPVIEALQRGAVLLLDEIDLASNKILCLQSILEGTGVYLKKTGVTVTPSPGFTVFATANTKGKGSDDGRFIGTNVLNEAFLERFPLTFEQEYPVPRIETKMLNNYCSELGCCDEEFITNLCTWADVIRKTFAEGGIDEVISTRRLVHIIRAFSIFDNRLKAIKLCLNRFDDETKSAFLELYSKIDAKIELNPTLLDS